MIAIVCAGLAYQLDIASGSVAWLIGAAVFLFCGQVHAFMGRAQERRMLETELKNLHRAHRIVGEELEETRKRMRNIASATESKAAHRNEQIVSEVRLLETLVQRLADGEEIDTNTLKMPVSDDDEIRPLHAAAAESVSTSTGLESIFDQLSEAELLNLVRGALEENRIDVYLQPIVSLPQRKLRFYESLSRLRTVEGEVVQPNEYLNIAESAGLISVIDNLLLFRCVQIVRHLVRREKDLAIFCNMSFHSLSDQSFFPQFLDFMKHNADLANNLIFEFGQPIVGSCGPMEQSNMKRLAKLGFRFSMDKIEDLDLDLWDLREKQFRFVKVSAEVFMNALPDEDTAAALRPIVIDALDKDDADPEGIELLDDIEIIEAVADVEFEVEEQAAYSEQDEDSEDDGEPEYHLPQKIAKPNIHAADFKELLNRYDIDLIVEKIESERDVIDVVELGVDFGQGFLFGVPRPVRNLDVDEHLQQDEPGQDKSESVSQDERLRAS